MDPIIMQGRIQVLRKGGGGPIYLMYPCSVFEVGGGMLHACQPSFIRTEIPSFWRLTSVSFEGHIEKEKMEYIFANHVQWRGQNILWGGAFHK